MIIIIIIITISIKIIVKYEKDNDKYLITFSLCHKIYKNIKFYSADNLLGYLL